MRTKHEIDTLLWMLSEDPNGDFIRNFFAKYEAEPPGKADVQAMMVLAETLFNQGDSTRPADFSALTWASKQLFLVAWILGREDIMSGMKDIPYSGWQSMGHKVKIFRELYEGETNGGEAEEASLGSN